MISDNEQFFEYIYTVKISLTFTSNLRAAELPLILVFLLTALKLYYVEWF